MSDINPTTYIDLSFGQDKSYDKNLTKLNTEILFTHVGLAEGPVYRINPNGPQDIRVENKFIDDLINEFDQPDPYVFQFVSSTGSVEQPVLQPFGSEITNTVRFSSPIVLKAGQSAGIETGVPQANLQFFPTSNQLEDTFIDTLVVKLSVEELYRTGTDNNNAQDYQEQRLDLRILVHPIQETSDLDNYIAALQKSFSAIITFATTLDIPITIPKANLSKNGYRLSVLKASDDSSESGISSEVSLLGFDEIAHDSFSYPRTATIGYALKATNFRNQIPDFTSMVKGSIVKVPSNLDQPILDNGEVDWRELEVSNPEITGYKLQSDPDTIIYETNPTIFKGIWDGKFKLDWTQDAVWQIYDLLTDKLGIDESEIDKFNFYSVSQITHGIDPNSGKFFGVPAYADGTFRHKPRGQFSSILENQLGQSSSTLINERRFISDIYISNQIDVFELISKLASSIRCVLSLSGNKIQLIADAPGSIPEQLFNDADTTNISFSGLRREEKITAVEVVFNNAAKNFNRDVIRIEDPDAINVQEKVLTLELLNCSRRSQATRFAQYILASNRYIKRKVNFSTSTGCEHLYPGAIISLSTQVATNILGYNGIVQEDSNNSNTRIKLQHIAFPRLSNNVFNANTAPLVLRHFSNDSSKSELYLLSNTSYELSSTGNTYSALNNFDYVEVQPIAKWNYNIKEFENFSVFDDLSIPKAKDLWALGEINPSNYYSSDAGKLYRVDTLNLKEDSTTEISASEYVDSVYIDSETLINYDPLPIRVISNPFATPAPPLVGISTQFVVTPGGNVIPNLYINITGSTGLYLTQVAFIPLTSFVAIL